MGHRHILEILDLGVILLDGVIEDCNQKACAMLGVSRDDLIGHTLESLPSADHTSMELLQVYLWKALDGKPQQLTWSLMKDGELQYFDLLVKTISVDERTKLVLTLQDENTCGGKITPSEAELARLDAALEERSEFIEIIMDHLPIGLVVLSLDALIIQYLNRKIEEILGWKRDFLTDLPGFLAHAVPEKELCHQLTDLICADIRSGDPARMTWQLPIVTGRDEDANIFMFATPVPGRNELILWVQDITERKQLQESEEQFRALVDQASDSIFLMDAGGHFVDVNQAACNQLGYSREELLTMSVADIDPGFSNDQHVKRYWKPLQRGQSVIFEALHQRKDGSDFPVEVVLGMIRLRKGKLFLGIHRDLTRRKQDEEALRNSEERRYKLQVELDYAAQLQQKLLPTEVPKLKGFEIAASCRPASHVAGDFYDWQKTGPEFLTFTLGDVMGKGLAAAMLMATVRSVLRGVARKNSPKTALEHAEKALRQDLFNADSFVTLFYAQLDVEIRSMRFVDCGHGHVFVRRKDGQVEDLLPRGLPLGVIETEEFSEGLVTFRPGDALILYSDGLIDALPERHIDTATLSSHLTGAKSANEMMARLTGLVPTSIDAPDDLTVLVLLCKR